MNKQAVEQANSVPTDNELNRTEFQNNLKQHPTNKLSNNKSNGQDKITNNNNLMNEQIRTSTTKKKIINTDQTDNQTPITSNLNNSSSYQNDNSVYYTPVYNLQNTKQTNVNHKSIIESTNQVNGIMDCSFDNSIVPIASCSSVSSRRSSISSCQDNQCNKNHHRKKSTNSKKSKDESNDNHKLHFNKNHNSSTKHLSGHHQRKQRILKSERNHYHNLESSNELDAKFGNENELNNQAGDYKHYHHLTADDNQHHNNQATELFEHHSSDRNHSPLSEDDSLPYFQTSSFSQDVCNKLRWKLKYHLSNPIEKWQRKRKFPFKLLLQIIKIIFVTIHVLTYGSTMSRFLTHQGNMLISFRELLLNNWDPVREGVWNFMAYPPSAGAYAIYTKTEFFSNFDFAVKSFSSITKEATGSFGYLSNNTDEVSPIDVCFKIYANGSMEPSQFIYDYNNAIKKKCHTLDSMGPAGSDLWKSFSFEQYLKNKSINLDFDRIIEINLKFKLRTIYLNSLETGSYPECYDVQIKIDYDNSKHDGQILINLKTKSFLRECKGVRNNTSDIIVLKYKINSFLFLISLLYISIDLNSNLVDKVGVRLHKYEKTFLHILVIILCLISFTLCTRSLIRSHKLGNETKQFFKQHFRRHLTLEDQLEFYDFWIIMITVNDVFIITGTILLHMQHTNIANFDYTTCTMFLGVGIFLVWTGILRYLSFFKKYNVVILTAKRAMPDILRFIICVLLLYCAFCLCGWIVLGPYHLKFRTLSRTSECLFSLLNGDDMFATFATTEANDYAIWIFSRIYLYGFITIFIYIILSLFISIIMDAYTIVKEYYITGIPLTDLHKFISECDENPNNNDMPQREHRHSMFSFRNCIRSCCHCTDNSSYEGF